MLYILRSSEHIVAKVLYKIINLQIKLCMQALKNTICLSFTSILMSNLHIIYQRHTVYDVFISFISSHTTLVWFQFYIR